MKRFLAPLLLLALLACVLPAQEDPAAERPAEAQPPFSAKMILVRADWSSVPAAKEIGEELRAALKDAVLPSGLLELLPASGPEILFGPEMVSLYTNEHYAELKAWLKAKDLIVAEEALPLPEVIRGTTPPGSYTGRKGESFYTYLVKDDAFMELPRHGKPDQPFVSRKPELTWNFISGVGQGGDLIAFQRQLTIREEVRGQASKTDGGPVLGRVDFHFALRDDRVALVNAFPSKQDSVFRGSAREKGFEAVIVLFGHQASKPSDKATPRVHSPDEVQVVTPNHSGQVYGGSGGSSSRESSSRPTYPRSFRSAATPETTAETPAVNPAELTQIVSLKYALAAQTAPLLQQLFAGEAMTLVADERSNSLIVRGSQQTLEKIEAIAAQLDRPVEDANIQGENLRDPGVPGPARSALESERQQGELKKYAEKLRAMLEEYGPKHPEVVKVQRAIRNVVASEFDARQKALQAELAEFRRRMTRIEQSLGMREKVREEIIDRRVQELLEGRAPDLQVPPGYAPADPAAAPGGEGSPFGGPLRDPDAMHRSAVDLAAANHALGPITQLRVRLAGLADDVKRAQDSLKLNPGHAEFTRDHKLATAGLKAAQEELDTLIRLQKLEVQEAEAQLSGVKSELDLAEKANSKQPGAISQNELTRLGYQALSAAVRLEKAKTMLEFLEKAKP